MWLLTKLWIEVKIIVLNANCIIEIEFENKKFSL
jgi:hypothetical protein